MKSKTSQEISAPRVGSKQAKLVAMLSRKTGVTIDKASTTFGWQAHTTIAALTGLKKRGYVIERVDRDNKDSVYIIRGIDDDAS